VEKMDISGLNLLGFRQTIRKFKAWCMDSIKQINCVYFKREFHQNVIHYQHFQVKIKRFYMNQYLYSLLNFTRYNVHSSSPCVKSFIQVHW